MIPSRIELQSILALFLENMLSKIMLDLSIEIIDLFIISIDLSHIQQALENKNKKNFTSGNSQIQNLQYVDINLDEKILNNTRLKTL